MNENLLELQISVHSTPSWAEWFWGVNSGEKLPTWYQWMTGTIPGHELSWFRWGMSSIIKPLGIFGYYLALNSTTVISYMYEIFTPLVPDPKVLSGTWVIATSIVLGAILIY